MINKAFIEDELQHLEITLGLIKELLQKAQWSKTLRGMLGFRHLQIHGYGYMMDQQKLRANSVEVVANHHIFVAHIRKILDEE